ncbi:hypothetical protein KIN20_018164 [Parelaphostrongylus tenuis]|uniref:Uncharacterized protein n=1 Tax=Parelaphostrongylus tenuis TaxID=148309 RepID=A0AAD5N3Y2_PARTN|nr:hypothetical protein KIN20_018164 [Parelaphostrongylus tenuis]
MTVPLLKLLSKSQLRRRNNQHECKDTKEFVRNVLFAYKDRVEFYKSLRISVCESIELLRYGTALRMKPQSFG